MLHVGHVWPGLVYAPKRWRTRDGVIPYRLLWGYAQGLGTVLALDRMTLARAIGLAMAGDDAGNAAQEHAEEAFPG